VAKVILNSAHYEQTTLLSADHSELPYLPVCRAENTVVLDLEENGKTRVVSTPAKLFFVCD